jgi:hypothetical protein
MMTAMRASGKEVGWIENEWIEENLRVREKGRAARRRGSRIENRGGWFSFSTGKEEEARSASTRP